MPTYYDKSEFLLRGRKVKLQQIAGSVTDAYWRNNLARAKKEAKDEYTPKSTLVFSQFEPDPMIHVEATLKKNRNIVFVDDQERPIRFPGVECSVETIDLETPDISQDDDEDESESGFGDYPVLWHGGDWAGFTSNYMGVENCLNGDIYRYERGISDDSELDILAVLIEGLCEHFQAVQDHRSGKKYDPDDLIEGDDEITIDSKQTAIHYCQRLISQLEKDITELKAGTYYPIINNEAE